MRDAPELAELVGPVLPAEVVVEPCLTGPSEAQGVRIIASPPSDVYTDGSAVERYDRHEAQYPSNMFGA